MFLNVPRFRLINTLKLPDKVAVKTPSVTATETRDRRQESVLASGKTANFLPVVFCSIYLGPVWAVAQFVVLMHLMVICVHGGRLRWLDMVSSQFFHAFLCVISENPALILNRHRFNWDVFESN